MHVAGHDRAHVGLHRDLDTVTASAASGLQLIAFVDADEHRGHAVVRAHVGFVVAGDLLAVGGRTRTQRRPRPRRRRRAGRRATPCSRDPGDPTTWPRSSSHVGREVDGLPEEQVVGEREHREVAEHDLAGERVRDGLAARDVGQEAGARRGERVRDRSRDGDLVGARANEPARSRSPSGTGCQPSSSYSSVRTAKPGIAPTCSTTQSMSASCWAVPVPR